MSRQTRELTTLRFDGPRFEGAWLDVDVLPDLVAYKELIIETAKQLWRRDHPSRIRLPPHFDAVAIKFREIRPGSTIIPLVRDISDEIVPQLPFDDRADNDHFDTAAAVIEESIDAAARDIPLPDLLPRTVVPLFDRFGKTLREGEAIFARARTRSKEVRYTEAVRLRITAWLTPTYEDLIDKTGEIRMADIDGRNFILRIGDGSKIQGKFVAEQESAITGALSEHETRRVRIKGSAEFSRDNGGIKRILHVEDVKVIEAGAPEYDPDERPVWEIAEELAATLPAEKWEKIPTDLARHHKHYLYGAPKK